MRTYCSELFSCVLIVEPDVFEDKRGYFFEAYQMERYSKAGIPSEFVQDNISYSRKGVLRGLHYQVKMPQGKLVWVVQGEIFDVVVDLRRSSPTFGKWWGMSLSANPPIQIYVPGGFAHGFCVISSEALVCYKCTDYYSPSNERGVRWDDPDLAIKWPVASPIVSEKDQRLPFLKDLGEQDLFP